MRKNATVAIRHDRASDAAPIIQICTRSGLCCHASLGAQIGGYAQRSRAADRCDALPIFQDVRDLIDSERPGSVTAVRAAARRSGCGDGVSVAGLGIRVAFTRVGCQVAARV